MARSESPKVAPNNAGRPAGGQRRSRDARIPETPSFERGKNARQRVGRPLTPGSGTPSH